MTKKTARQLLTSGKTIQELFQLSPGQEGIIFKADNFSVQSIIYIPDIDLNELCVNTRLKKDEIEEALANMYTGQDFINECAGCRKMAEYLFDYVDWQHPSSALNCDFRMFSDEEMIDLCGKTYEEFFFGSGETKENKKNKQKYYNRKTTYNSVKNKTEAARSKCISNNHGYYKRNICRTKLA